ncbi:MAG: hypothetical protein LBU74_06510 [Methanobacteriaceae archaeon]|jgi:predicted outer membrane repeat protein|nr:hypothetical protein [Candidatus Methanorudis spinitermitis]
MVLSFLFIVCSLQTPYAANQTIDNTTVGGIAQGINNTGIGEILFLQPGIYNKAGDIGIMINKSITIQGNGSTDTVIIDGQKLKRIFEIRNNNIKFINITFINGNNTNGGAIYNNNKYANITFINCKFINNTATSSGGAISNSNGYNFVLINCTFTNNKATYDGGAIYEYGSNITLIDCIFTNNTAEEYGGAIFIGGGFNFTIINSNFTNNTAQWGGAIFGWLENDVKIINSTFTNNTAKDVGAAGGAIYFEGNNYLIVNSTFTNNVATFGYGGALINHGANNSIINCTFTNNRAYYSGGAIYVYNKSYVGTESYSFKIMNSNFTNNTAQFGGAIYNQCNSSTIINSKFSNNNASNRGGAIYNIGNLSVTNSNFENNLASYYGGAIYNNGFMGVFNNTMKGNFADLGQMIYNNGNMGILNLTYLKNSTIKVVKGQIVTLYATLTDDMGNTVTGQSISFMVNGTSIGSANSVEGYASINYTVPDFEDLLPVSGDYAGHTNYQIILLNGQLRAAIETNSTINTPNNVKVGQKINITGTATDKNGNPIANTIITVTVNGKTYTVTTDGNGNWILSYTPTQAGNIIVSVQWDGNDSYFGFINSTSFDVTGNDSNSTDENKTNNTDNNTDNPINDSDDEELDHDKNGIGDNNKDKGVDNNLSKPNLLNVHTSMKSTGINIAILLVLAILTLVAYRRNSK